MAEKVLRSNLFFWGFVPRDRQEMIDFLEGHFRYGGSYARNVKVNRLNLSREARDACYAMLEMDAWDMSGYNAELHAFTEAHLRLCRIDTEGRNGGYLVLRTHHRTEMDAFANWEDWDRVDLKGRVELVTEFDQVCAAAVARYVDFAMSNRVVDKVVTVEKTIKVIEARE